MAKKGFFKKILAVIGACLPLFCLTACNGFKEQLNSLSDIQNNQSKLTFGAPALTYCAEFFDEGKNVFPDYKDLKIYDDVAAAYEALKQGKIDVFVQDYSMARVEIDKGVTGVKIIDDVVGESDEIGIGISNTSPISKTQIDAFFTSLSNDGVFDDMQYRWAISKTYVIPFDIHVPTDSSLPLLTVATSGVVEPYSFYDSNNKITGFDVELSMRIAEHFNMRLSFLENSSYPGIISAVESGIADLLIANLYLTEERRTQMQCSIPYSVTRACCVVRDSQKKSYNTFAELKGKRIGYDKTSVQFEQCLQNGVEDPVITSFNSTPDCLAALLHGRLEGYVCDLPVAKMTIAKEPSVKIVDEYLALDEYGFPFEKGSPLAAEFDTALNNLKQDGTLKELEDVWFSQDSSNKVTFKQDPNKTYKRTVKALTTGLLEPMCYLDENNNPIGYDIDVFIRICEALDYRAEFSVKGDFSACVIELENGMCDSICNCISITPERQENFDFTHAYFDGAVVIVVKNYEAIEKPFFEKLADSFNKTFVVEQRWKMILSGIGVTLLISICSGVIGILIGFGLCMVRMHSHKPVKAIAKWFIKLIQGAPIVVLLMIMYYLVFGQIDINAIIVAILTYGINFGVYSSEIMRSGFENVDNGQVEAAWAMGYSRQQTFTKISLPQAAKSFIPVLRGEFISMVKMTSVAGYISVAELTRVGDIIRSKTMEAFFPLIVIALIYFGLSELLTFGLTLIDKNLDYLNKNREVKGVTRDGK